MGTGFAPTCLRQVSPTPLLHMTTLITGDRMPVTLDLLNQKSIDFDIRSMTPAVPRFKLLRSGVFVLSC